jgi:hypothetical protein
MATMYPKRQSSVLAMCGSLAVCLGFSLFGFLSIAHAAVGEYDVEVCTPQGNARGHGLAFHEDDRATDFLTVPCELEGLEPTIAITAEGGVVSQFAEWTLDTPAGALIRSVQGNRRVRLVGSNISPSIRWIAFPDDPMAMELERFSLGAPPTDGRFTWTPAAPGTRIVHARVVCQASLGCINEDREEQISFTNVIAHVVDQSPPTVTAAGSLLNGGPIRGTKELSFKASDEGGGIAKVSLVIDGNVKESKTDPNGGLCARPYQAMVPCMPEIDSSFNLDTETLADGPHTVAVVVEDASGQTGASAATVDVHNRPVNTTPPALSGNVKIGEVLATSSGQWDGSPIFTYRWLRCPASFAVGQEASCTPVGADREIYEVAGADAGGRLVAEVTAANSFGSAIAFSAPSATVAASGGPVGGRSAPETKIAKHPRKKTTSRTAKFTFNSDQPGSSFECRLGKASFKLCRSPFKHKLKPGRHSFQVRAINASGMVDPSPAVFRWAVS